MFHELQLDRGRWKQYGDLITSTLWTLGARARGGSRSGRYHGNWAPQVPDQLMRRFSRTGDVVLDLFAGSGTTLLEALRLGRYGIGVELSGPVARETQKSLEAARFEGSIGQAILVGDSSGPEIRSRVIQAASELTGADKDFVDLVLLHPPYWDIISFSSNPACLSQCAKVEEWVCRLEKVVANAVALLAPGRFLAMVIADCQRKGQLVPLGMYAMRILDGHPELRLRACCVKDMQGNERGSGKQANLWRWRALRNGFYTFGHEYVMLARRRSNV